ncbi:hypothetical protein LTR08_007302 [Meristemomyces frigidus]|nr:hypothetical protein LTR08_007302 [Meristemomyces frigidus]
MNSFGNPYGMPNSYQVEAWRRLIQSRQAQQQFRRNAMYAQWSAMLSPPMQDLYPGLPPTRGYPSTRTDISTWLYMQTILEDVLNQIMAVYPPRPEFSLGLDRARATVNHLSMAIANGIATVPAQVMNATEPAIKQAAAYNWIADQIMRSQVMHDDAVSHAITALRDTALNIVFNYQREQLANMQDPANVQRPADLQALPNVPAPASVAVAGKQPAPTSADIDEEDKLERPRLSVVQRGQSTLQPTMNLSTNASVVTIGLGTDVIDVFAVSQKRLEGVGSVKIMHPIQHASIAEHKIKLLTPIWQELHRRQRLGRYGVQNGLQNKAVLQSLEVIAEELSARGVPLSGLDLGVDTSRVSGKTSSRAGAAHSSGYSYYAITSGAVLPRKSSGTTSIGKYGDSNIFAKMDTIGNGRVCHDWLCLNDGHEMALHHPLAHGDLDPHLNQTVMACIKDILNEKNNSVSDDEQQDLQIALEYRARAQSTHVAAVWLKSHQPAKGTAAPKADVTLGLTSMDCTPTDPISVTQEQREDTAVAFEAIAKLRSVEQELVDALIQIIKSGQADTAIMAHLDQPPATGVTQEQREDFARVFEESANSEQLEQGSIDGMLRKIKDGHADPLVTRHVERAHAQSQEPTAKLGKSSMKGKEPMTSESGGLKAKRSVSFCDVDDDGSENNKTSNSHSRPAPSSSPSSRTTSFVRPPFSKSASDNYVPTVPSMHAPQAMEETLKTVDHPTGSVNSSEKPVTVVGAEGHVQKLINKLWKGGLQSTDEKSRGFEARVQELNDKLRQSDFWCSDDISTLADTGSDTAERTEAARADEDLGRHVLSHDISAELGLAPGCTSEGYFGDPEPVTDDASHVESETTTIFEKELPAGSAELEDGTVRLPNATPMLESDK